MALAMVLLAAAGLKARQLAGHTEASLPGFLHNRMVLAAIVQAELLLCLWLLAGGWRRLRFVCATGCFLLFGTVAMYEALHAMPSCGCFGNVKVPPILTAIFDFVAVAMLWLSRPDNADSPQKPPTRMRLAMASVAALATSTALWTGTLSHPPPPSSGEKTLIVLEPATWLNQPFSLLDELDGPADLRHGRWIVVMYHYDCEDCLEALPAYKNLATAPRHDQTSPRVAFVPMPPPAPPGADPVPDIPAFPHFTLHDDHDWFATTPVVVALQDGMVIAAADGQDAVRPPRIDAWK